MLKKASEKNVIAIFETAMVRVINCVLIHSSSSQRATQRHLYIFENGIDGCDE